MSWKSTSLTVACGLALLGCPGWSLRAQKTNSPASTKSVSGMWRSQTTGNEYRVEIEGGILKAERMDLPKDSVHEGAYVRTTAQHQGSNWIGKTQIFLPCALGHGPIINKCHLTMGFEITEVGPNLIRGMIENPDLNKFDCKSCNTPKKEWKDFVWVPEKR